MEVKIILNIDQQKRCCLHSAAFYLDFDNVIVIVSYLEKSKQFIRLETKKDQLFGFYGYEFAKYDIRGDAMTGLDSLKICQGREKRIQ